jgi:tumor protein p53-inducible protein 3
MMTSHEGVDLILDPVMGSTFFNNNLKCMGFECKYVIYGFMGGIKIKHADMQRVLNKNASIHTTTLRNRPADYKAKLLKDMSRNCLPGFESGELRPVIDSVYSLT